MSTGFDGLLVMFSLRQDVCELIRSRIILESDWLITTMENDVWQNYDRGVTEGYGKTINLTRI